MDWSRLRWLLQSNLGSARDLAAMESSLDRVGVAHERLTVVPFDDTLPEVSPHGLTLFYGATTLIANVARAGTYTPGVFFDPARFAFEALRDGYGSHLLNGDSEVMTVSALLSRDLAPGDEFFLRPAHDGKEFAGSVFTGAELTEWRARVGGSHGPLSLDTRVQLSAPKTLAREWRVFVVDGRPVAASRYRTRFRLDVSPDVPVEVLDFARTMAARYAPAEVFTLDLGETDRGLSVIETNCFNSSGFYACDVDALVRSVTSFILKRY